MTVLTYPNNTIMAFVTIDSAVVGLDNTTCLPDWAGSNVYLFSTGNGATRGLRACNIDPDGVENLQRAKGSIGVNWVFSESGGAASLSADLASLYFVSDPANSCQLARVRASDFSLQATFGTASGDVSPSDAGRILSVNMLVPCGSGEMFAAPFGTGAINDGELDILPVDISGNLNLGNMDEQANNGTVAGASPTVSYAIGLGFTNGSGVGDHTIPLGLYRIDPAGSFVKKGTVAPVQIDATWTHILFVGGIAFDQTDGNLLIAVQTNDAVANQNYIVKISASSAAVMWKVAVSGLSPYPWGMSWSRISNGKFHYFGSGVASPTAYHIKTSDGSVTTETVTGLTSSTIQISDDVTNSIVYFGGFNAGGSPPDYVGALMGGGTHNVSNHYFRFWFATAAPPPPVGSGRRHLGELGPVFAIA